MNRKAKELSDFIRHIRSMSMGEPRKVVVVILVLITVIILITFLGIIDLNQLYQQFQSGRQG